MSKFSKLYIALKFRLFGMGYFKAMEALEKGREIHDSIRKDGITPEYQHQIEIALFILTLKDVKDLETCLILALFHDTLEDYPERISEKYILDNFGELVYSGLQSLNKYTMKMQDGCFQKVAKTPSEYFGVIGEDKNTAIVKLSDRVNNLQSMQRGKFTLEKQRKYVEEVKTYFLPMAKRVRLANPEYMDAFYNLETMLKFQIEFVEMFIGASQTND